MTDTGSSVPRRQLGRYLKQAREQAGITLEAAARDQEWSRATMYRIEGGYAAVRRADVVSMCTAYGVSAKMTEALIALAAETKAKGWWHAHGAAIPSWFELYVGLESAASRLRHFEPASVPGLLQTREYAEALLRSHPEIADEEVDRLVFVRMERQQLLRRKSPTPPQLDVLLDEAALRRQVPGMARQLRHLNEQGKTNRVSIRVVPTLARLNYALAGGSFVILDFPAVGVRTPEPTTVYCESLTGALYLDKPTEVATYDGAWKALEDSALDPGRSADLIAMIAKEIDNA
ncbi:helix-turn-helix domain-containing protein [Micromonospora sp. NBC_01796]|uniref:helix-turn-helix domain-containing protein n=1 Tax=Micromonospora sp. NBC_01796 TaxID=2975987 RepID=UPI002DD84C94|nr:helix-turn-helix transcriptional regulator [Micromonospora sp. NBC_01796]WSA83383.1 helix-turn-helix domain-containing protein [Micromonospora sp. NBC_01796]